MIATWTPPEWVYNCFPLPEPDAEIVTLEYLLEEMHSAVDACTEWDDTPIGPMLHLAHMLVSHQGRDGLWSTAFNLRTGDDTSQDRTGAPVAIFRRLNKILGSTEFDIPIRHAEAGIAAQDG